MKILKFGIMRSRDLAVTTLPILILLITASVGPGQTYDPALQFSATNNPHGHSSYGYSINLGGPLIPYTTRTNINGINLWYTNIFQIVPLVGHNPTTNTVI